MGKIGILDHILLIDPRFLLVLVATGFLYYRPVLTVSGASAGAGACALDRGIRIAIKSGRELDFVRLSHAVIIGFLVWLTAGLLPLLAQSVRWPLIHDAPIMHYIAWRMLHGAVPYRDIFDMNLPGVYLIHLAVLKAFGPSDAGWRLFDFLWLVGTDLLLWRSCRGRGRGWGAAAVLLYTAFHLSSGAPGMGQRDYLEFTFLLGGLLLAVGAFEHGLDFRRLFLSGLTLGCAASIKPLAVLLLIAAACMAAAHAYRQPGRLSTLDGVGTGLGPGAKWSGGRGRAVAAAAFTIAGGILVPGMFAIWLAAIGGLKPFLDTFAGVMPLYSRMHDRPFIQYLVEYWPVWLPCTLTVPVALMYGRPDARRLLLILGVVYGALHYVIQNKGWPYQLYPLVGFASALIAVTVSDLARTAQRSTACATASLAVFLTLTIGLWDGRLHPANALTADTLDTVESLRKDLGGRLAPGVTAQSFDTTGGCSHALMRMNSPLPTRFLCDFLFYSYPNRPYVRQLRAELMAEMRARPPKFLIVYRWGWPSGQYERTAQFPELHRWIQDNYRIDTTRSKYVIYSRRAD